jgi:hypothetical protein
MQSPIIRRDIESRGQPMRRLNRLLDERTIEVVMALASSVIMAVLTLAVFS